VSPKEERLIEYALKYAHKSVGKNIHVSLLVIRNKIINHGVNSYLKTSPLGGKDRFYFVHSELSCIKRFNFRENNIKKATLYNFRFAKKDCGLLLSRPCENCFVLCKTFGIRRIAYSTENGIVYETNN
jgi:tRNA(Arg) A34 adenosine deaminase TadA